MISVKVAFVLRLVDDFSGKAISGKKFLFENGEGQALKPLEKSEGMYVFLEPTEEEARIWIRGSDYYSHMVTVQKKQLDEKNPVLDVRLYGRPGGSFPYRSSLVEGRISQKGGGYPALICAKTSRDTLISLKEIKQQEDGTHLIVNGFSREVFIGKTFAMTVKKKTEVFVITEKIGMNEYKIDRNLIEKYPQKTPIERVYCSVTDSQGNYAIPVEPGEQDQIAEVIILQNKLFHHEGKEV
ncbi:MAG: hypothetical protein ACI4DO_06670 [Roseburia sp.]